MKMNKKGFTLIEMLVVIAIIAVLVSIIVPTVSSSTVKAKAAADAANLRSVLSEATIELAANSNFDVTTLNDSADCETDSSLTLTVTKSGDEVAVAFAKQGASYGIDVFAYVAENGGTLAEAATAVAG